MMRFHIIIAWLVVVNAAATGNAGITIGSQDLFNLVRDSSGPSSIQDSDSITSISNPLLQSSTAQLGNNIASSTYDYNWIEDIGVGDFKSIVSQQMLESVRVSTATRQQIFIETDVDLIVTFDGSIDYSHTPGDETQFLFGMSVRDVLTTEVFFTQSFEGGNADLLPASGTLAVSGETIIPAGGLYRLQVALSADNFDEDSAGIYDANGFANISIRPVPEPASALLLLPTVALLRYRRR